MSVIEDRHESDQDIEEVLGLNPEWLQRVPDYLLPTEWASFKSLVLSETAIPNKYKEMIGLAVSGATRCRYCAYFHTEAARTRSRTWRASAGGGSGAARIASSAIRAPATSADSSWLVAVTVNTFSRARSMRMEALCRLRMPLADAHYCLPGQRSQSRLQSSNP